MPLMPVVIISSFVAAHMASACISFASASLSFPFTDAITPPTANTGSTTIPARTNYPPAIPKPPTALDPPPKKARVAFVLAAPESAAIAVPVEADANIMAPP